MLQRAGDRLERASSEIADLQAFNQHVIDSLTSGLATTDLEGRILTFNRAAEVITGRPAVSVIGRIVENVDVLPFSDVAPLSIEQVLGMVPRRPMRAGEVITAVALSEANDVTGGGLPQQGDCSRTAVRYPHPGLRFASTDPPHKGEA